jgi:hypothetical protein
MNMRNASRLVLFGLALCAPVSGAYALTAKECSAKFKEAQKAGTLGGMKWNDFRKAECGADVTASQPVAAPAPGAAANPLKPAAKPAPATGSAVFPTAVAAQYASEKPGTARMHTCRDQFQANKASGANGGLPWIRKGGGYYSECNARLKG